MAECKCDMDGRGKACHCRRCCVTFSGPSAFDQHIVRGGHLHPWSRGLVIVRADAKRGDVWGMPDSGRRDDLPRRGHVF